GGKKGALKMDVVADLPVVFAGQVGINNAASSIFLPGRELLGRHVLVGGNLEVFVGIGGKLREIVLRLVVDVCAAEPGHGNDVRDPGNDADLFTIINRKKVGERDLVARHDAKRGIGGSFVDVEAAPEAQHDAEQKQRERDAGDGEQAAAFVAEGGFGDEGREGHGEVIGISYLAGREVRGERSDCRGEALISRQTLAQLPAQYFAGWRAGD